MKTIQEYFATLVVAGLAPKENNIYGLIGDTDTLAPMIMCEVLYNNMKGLNAFKSDSFIQLRKDGIDLVKLEWQEPTEQDVGKMCWFYSPDAGVLLSELKDIEHDSDEDGYNHCLWYYSKSESWAYCLLATHSRLAPEPKDFEEAYK